MQIPEHVYETARTEAQLHPKTIYAICVHGRAWSVRDASLPIPVSMTTVAFAKHTSHGVEIESVTVPLPGSLAMQTVEEAAAPPYDRFAPVNQSPLAYTRISLPPLAEPLPIHWAPLLYEWMGWMLYVGSAVAVAGLLHSWLN